MSETRIRADIHFEAVDLAKPAFDELKARIEEIADEFKATVTIDGRMYPATAEAGDETETGTRPCGHDDYHDAHEWADRPGVWCPGHSIAGEARR